MAGSGLSRGPIKVSGGNFGTKQSVPKPAIATAPKEPLEQKLVSNVPGEEKIWKYPSLDLLIEAEIGKADRETLKAMPQRLKKLWNLLELLPKWLRLILALPLPNMHLRLLWEQSSVKLPVLSAILALALAAPTGTIRIEAPIPGRILVGIELPNRSAEFVSLKKMMESDEMHAHKSKLGGFLRP